MRLSIERPLRLSRWMAGVASAFVACCGVAAAAEPTPSAVQRKAEHAQIVAERVEANARFDERRRDCQARFVVTACMKEATEERRAVLARLHERELALGDAQRREAAALRESAIAAKAGSAPVQVDVAASAARHEAHRPSTPNPPAAIKSREAASSPTGITAEQRRQQEARNRAAFDAKAREVEAHRDAVLRRNAERAAHGKVAAPLPSGASAAP